jgi:hypothetical protein
MLHLTPDSAERRAADGLALRGPGRRLPAGSHRLRQRYPSVKKAKPPDFSFVD